MRLSSTSSDIKFDNSTLPSLKEAWNDQDRVGKPAIMTFGDLGVTDLPKNANCVAYLDVAEHAALSTPDPRHVFDDIHLDRLFSYATFREWSRHDMDPRRGILMMGPSGTGKTTYLENRFAQRGIPLYSETGSPDAVLSDWIMTKEIVNGTTFWAEGALLMAMREGVPFVIQEIDLLAPAQLTSINEIIDKGICLSPEDKSIVRAKRGFQVFATCNSSFTEDRTGGFSGTRRQNQSVLNRFYKYTCGYASVQQEAECIVRVHPELPMELATRMAQFADLTRTAAAEGGLDGRCMSQGMSRRHLLDWADMLKGMSYLRNHPDKIDLAEYTLNFVYSGNLDAEELATVKHFLSLSFNADTV